jgi:hypothetical protein
MRQKAEEHVRIKDGQGKKAPQINEKVAQVSKGNMVKQKEVEMEKDEYYKYVKRQSLMTFHRIRI